MPGGWALVGIRTKLRTHRRDLLRSTKAGTGPGCSMKVLYCILCVGARACTDMNCNRAAATGASGRQRAGARRHALQLQ